MEHPLNESAWCRGWQATKSTWTDWRFLAFEAVMAPLLGFFVEWWWSIVLVAGGMLCIWIGATASAPVKQRNEARQRIKEIESEKPKMLDILCPTTSIGLPINRLDDGSYQASSIGVGFAPLSIVHRGELATITRLTMSPEIRFTRADRWETTNAIQVTLGINPLAGPRTQDFAWDTKKPAQWVLMGLPLTLAKDELLTLPMMVLSISNGNEAGAHFEKGETCTLIMKFAIHTDKGFPPLPDQTISLTRSDIKNSLLGFGIHPNPKEGATQ